MVYRRICFINIVIFALMVRKMLFTSALLALFSGAAARDIDSLFLEVPEQVMPLLEHGSRLDMLDLYNCGMEALVINDMGGEARLLKKDSVSFLASTTDVSRVELRQLSYKKDTIYSCVRTVDLPEPYSQITFLDKSWKLVPVQLPQKVHLADCWFPSDSLSEARIEELRLLLSPVLFSLHWESGTDGFPVLIYEVSVNHLLPEDQRDAKKCLRPKRYYWNEGKFLTELIKK